MTFKGNPMKKIQINVKIKANIISESFRIALRLDTKGAQAWHVSYILVNDGVRGWLVVTFAIATFLIWEIPKWEGSFTCTSTNLSKHTNKSILQDYNGFLLPLFMCKA